MAKISKAAYKQLIDHLEWAMETYGTPINSNSFSAVRETDKMLNNAYATALHTIDALHMSGLISFDVWSTDYDRFLTKYSTLKVALDHMLDAVIEIYDRSDAI